MVQCLHFLLRCAHAARANNHTLPSRTDRLHMPSSCASAYQCSSPHHLPFHLAGALCGVRGPTGRCRGPPWGQQAGGGCCRCCRTRGGPRAADGCGGRRRSRVRLPCRCGVEGSTCSVGKDMSAVQLLAGAACNGDAPFAVSQLCCVVCVVQAVTRNGKQILGVLYADNSCI